MRASSWLLLGAITAGAAFPAAARAERVYVCERPDGSVAVTRVYVEDREAFLERLRRGGHLPERAACWDMDSTALPSRDRPDPREPSASLTQRHRWRRGPAGTIIVDPAVKRPQAGAILREMRRLLPPSRMGQVLATPLGGNLLRVLREGDWPVVQALIRQARQQVGTAQEVLTQAELDGIGKIGDDYEADLR